jgi:aryl-alcohol dehydrogenase-like predicted oxidoreductase
VERRELGRTGISVSVLGLGTGGANVFGQARGASSTEVARVVRSALDLGVNLFDTAQAYREAEVLLGEALAGVPRSSYVLASKYTYRGADGLLLTPAEVEARIRLALTRLRTDVLDVMQIHALKPADYDEVVASHLPVLVAAREAGLIRAIGVTESFAGDDNGHEALVRALRDGWPETVMVGYNVLNQNAERSVFPLAEAGGVGVFIMAAVRRALKTRAALEAQVAELKAEGLIARDAVSDEDPLGWLVADGAAASVQAGCYRFAAEPSAVSSVLTGTFDPDHLAENAAALARGPLPPADSARLRSAFGHLELGLGR